MTMVFNRFYNMKMAVVDLSEGSAEIDPLPGSIIEENIGGAAVNSLLFGQYRREDPLVLGVGPLSGSFAPASCLMVASFRDHEADEICHTPLLLRAGPELKFSGIDFMVIKGASSRPQTLRISNAGIELLPADNIHGMDVSKAVKTLCRQDPTSDSFIILTGPAADYNSTYATASMGIEGSLDKCGMANWMTSKNLKAIIISGTGGLPFGENSLALSEKLKMSMAAQGQSMTKGCLSVLDKVGLPVKMKALVAKSIARHLACYNCPFPCISYIKIGNSARCRRGIRKGFVLLDHFGFLALARKRGRESFELMRECLRLGLNPAAIAEGLPSEGSLEEAIEVVTEIASVKERDGTLIKSGDEHPSGVLLRGVITPEHYRLFGGGIPPIVPDYGERNTWSWERRVAIAMVLGVCPLLMLLFPRVEAVELLRFLSTDERDVESLLEPLTASVELLLAN